MLKWVSTTYPYGLFQMKSASLDIFYPLKNFKGEIFLGAGEIAQLFFFFLVFFKKEFLCVTVPANLELNL